MRTASILLQLPVVLTVVALASLQAQVQPASAPDSIARVGERVRVLLTRSDSTFVTGRFRAMRNDSLWITPDSSDWTMAFARDDMARVDVEHDEKTRDEATTVMAIIGGLAGGASAIAICLNNQEACAADQRAAREAQCRGESYADWFTLLFSGGALLGAGLGYALAPAPHWDVVMVPSRMTGPDGQLHLGLNVGLRYSLARRKR